ncbi:SDR family NAD(P)-dependent oxidoreductase [Sorangium sp. So ce131]|uniref:SDR family NAD(P)-dependent oxidoreductase n=1 Tax=Sorangium sp. So ce131 TaxID=3133282 RepID=UPI003F5F1427
MSKLNGKVAVITGGSSGIGLAVARRFVEEGAYVFITGRRQGELDKARAQIGENVTTVQGDVTDAGDLDRLFAAVRSEKGAIDVLVTNAGLVESAPFVEATPEHFDRIFDLNVRGTFFTVQKALPLLADGGSVVLVSSAAGYKGFPGYSVYSASKAAVRSFARTWTAELKGRGIRVNSLSAGPIDTPALVQASSKEDADRLRQLYGASIPLGRIGRPEEVASAALFLASSESSYSSGIDLMVDGGIAQL